MNGQGAAPLVAALTALGSLVGCGATEDDGRPQVVVTTNILGDVAREVAGDQAQVTVLMRAGADPHSFEVSAQEAALMREADLVVSNGLGLEEGLQQHLDGAEEAGTELFVAGEHVEVLDYSADQGGAADPHFWTDPARMVAVTDALGDALADVAGVDPEAVEEQEAAYLSELAALDREMTEAFATIPEDRRSLVTNHHVFGYLAERFDFEVVGAVVPGGTTLASPSASDLDDLVGAIEAAQVPTIFAESSSPDRLVQVLADEADVEVAVEELFTESLSAPGEGAATYLEMQRTNTERITAGLAR